MFDKRDGGRLMAWQVEATAGLDCAWVWPGERRLSAEGQIFGFRPAPYRISYQLDTNDGWVTSRLIVESRTAAGVGRLEARQEHGTWTVGGEARPDLDGALDCDLAGCPLTNTMPILRHALHRQPGSAEVLVSFIQLPGLAVVPSLQRYRHLRRDGETAIVRYASDGFEADLVIDRDGFVVDYPKLGARRLASAT